MNITRPALNVAALIALLASAGCSITGLNAGSSYSCKAPEGVKCDSVSGTYHNAIANNLPSQRKTSGQPEAEPANPGVTMQEARYETAARPASLSTVAAKMGGGATAPQQAAPAHYSLRSGPRILRLWVKPWEDADGDLNGESVVYIQVEGGRWLVDHAQRQVRDAYAPVRVLGQRAPSAAGAAVSSDLSTVAKSPERPAPTVRQLSQALPEAATKALKSAQDQAVPDEAN